MLPGILTSLISTFAWGCVALIIFRYTNPDRRFPIMAWCFLCSILFWLACFFFWIQPAFTRAHPDPLIPSLVMGFVSHLLLFFLVVECYYHIDRSITLSMLDTILQHNQSGGVTGTALQAQHDVTDIIEERIETLRLNGYLAFQKERIELTPKGMLIAIVTLASTTLFKSQLQKDRIE